MHKTRFLPTMHLVKKSKDRKLWKKQTDFLVSCFTVTVEVRILSENRLSHDAYYRDDAKISDPFRKVYMFLQKPQIKVTQA